MLFDDQSFFQEAADLAEARSSLSHAVRKAQEADSRAKAAEQIAADVTARLSALESQPQMDAVQSHLAINTLTDEEIAERIATALQGQPTILLSSAKIHPCWPQEN